MSSTTFVAKKLSHLLAVVLLVSLGVTALLSQGGTVAAQILGPNANAGQIAELERQLGLDRPFAERYLSWLADAVRGDLGESLLTHVPVTEVIANGFAVTFELMVLGLGIALLVAVPLAAYTARNVGGKIDTIATGVSSLFMSLPSFVLAIGLLYVFAVRLGMLPVSGWVPLTEDPVGNLRSAILPSLVLALHPMATFFRVLRSDMITTLQQDFVLTARAKGLNTAYILLRHALRPSLTTLVSLAGLSIGSLMTGAVISEVIFRLPGMGSAIVNAVTQRDVPIVQGLVLLVALTYVVVNTLVDILQAVIDPRVQTS
ncbi:ABC transporter permease [Microtetraspora malaysiensis]|uniref:ABC transporter permease n=1 Tax=Microtetraspora malaysiensis TaxID=161358 RepID=UPI00083269E2|nr:ABC transporter permease [Microtetraspora malaysiensis]